MTTLTMARKRLLLGDEAVALAAIDAGIGGAFSYPGTPATEIFETIESIAARTGGLSARWSANEKVAYEEALGMSYAGKRALVSMKHVGLNVASDPFINSALTGVNGGLVLVVADDPGMHSSQNEQDSRFYAEFAQVPCFEPSNQQEAYDATLEAFEYAETIGLPVVLRLVTRLSHSRANVTLRDGPSNGHGRRARPDPSDWTLVPANARRRYTQLWHKQTQLLEDSEKSRFNVLRLAGSRGIIASGLAYNYVREALGESASDWSLLKIGMYPIPAGLIRRLIDHCDEILIVEEGFPFIEKRLLGVLGVPGKRIRGKLSGDLPLTGELTPDVVASALFRGRPGPPNLSQPVSPRPPQLCKGCPHSDTFRAMLEAVSGYAEPVLLSDIGCYTLGVLPPYRAVHACVDMGASIAMAHGASQAGAHPVLCTIGDSTFAHSGMTGLIGAAQADANMTVFILDNATTAMTGTQDSMTTGKRLLDVLAGLGVPQEHLVVLEPLPQRHAQNVERIKAEIEHQGLSVIVACRPCIHVRRKERADVAAV
jgi:indolepyruvate ferredoxin oxidoreductase, alpha subunit